MPEMMKYICLAIVIAIIIAVIGIFVIYPPCNGDYEFSIGGDEYLLFTCKKKIPTTGLVAEPKPPPEILKEKVHKTFVRTFDFKDTHCSINEKRSSNLCVDAGFTFTGMFGEPNYSRIDECGSQFVSFNVDPDNKQCGVFKVRLVGCGLDSLGICKDSAYIKGDVTLFGISD